ncbi:MAG: hypothetical protein J6J38_00185 [Lachnospiraceae bacterium]|nr:hypothetical protein [Lachnospiraceae bacterium]
MRKKQVLHYYVEGEDEKSLLEALKRDLGCIETGKVDIMNVIQTRFTVARIRPLKPGTIVVLVYDTDVETNMEILQFNIEFLKKQTGIKEVICIPQVRNLEDELRNACDIKAVRELTKSKTKTDYKRDIIRCSNLGERLRTCGFDIMQFWSRLPENAFRQFGNDAHKIKKDA